MGALAWVEVLDRRGHVRSRHRVDSMPALLGRGYGCDVLVDDPWISPIHVRIYRDLDGSFTIEDAGSENGLWQPGHPHPIAAVAMGGGVTLRAGRTTFRIVPANASVPLALAAHLSAPAAEEWERWWVGATAGALAGGAFGLRQLLDDPGSHRAAEVAGDALMMVAVAALWAGIWALATRALWHRARFLAHFIVVSVTALVMMAVVSAVGYAAFIAPGVPGFQGAFVVLSFVVATAMVYAHLTIATALSKPRAVAISTAVIFGLAALAALVADEDRAHGGSMPQFSAELKPLRSAIIPRQDTTAFFAGVKELKVSVDSLVHEPE